jgi:hypothetical protein
MTDDEKKAKVRELNDELRTKGGARNGKIIFTGALGQDSVEKRLIVYRAARAFNTFTEQNDPHGEHDFGRFNVGDEEFMFKFDYFALDEMFGSEHPEDPNATIRIMSIFYASDY